MIRTDKEHHEFKIIDIAIPHGTRVGDEEVEKIKKYLDLAKELKEVWIMKVKVVPLVVLLVVDTPAKALEKRLKTIGIETKVTELRKNCLDIYQQNPPKRSWGARSVVDTIP